MPKKTALKKPPKSCKCLEDLRKALEVDYGKVKLDTTSFLRQSATGTIREIIDFGFNWYPTKVDGTRSKKSTHSAIFFTYCPFCGKKYT